MKWHTHLLGDPGLDEEQNEHEECSGQSNYHPQPELRVWMRANEESVSPRLRIRVVHVVGHLEAVEVEAGLKRHGEYS